MRKFIALGIVLLAGQFCHAEFNLNRDTVGKSSFTESTPNLNVSLSTAASFVRSITFSGVEPTTISIYNCQLFTASVSTRTKVYWPGISAAPVTVYVDVINSSGTMYTKQGGAQATFNWDWYTRPAYKSPLNENN